MKLELVSVTTKTFLHAGRGCKPARRGGGEIKDGAMKSDFRGSSLYGSTSGYGDGALMNSTVATVLEQSFHERDQMTSSGMKIASFVDHP